MATDLEERPGSNEVGKVELDGKSDLHLSSIEEDLPKVKVGADCNGNGIVHQEVVDGEANENGHVSVPDPAQTGCAEAIEEAIAVEEKSAQELKTSTPIEGERDGESVDAMEKSGAEVKLSSQSEEERDEVKEEHETKHDVDVTVHDEGLKGEVKEGVVLENNGSVEEQARLGSDRLVEESQECATEGVDIADSGLNQPGHEEKVEEESKEHEVVEAVESNSHILENGEKKVEDQVALDCESESKERQDLNSELKAIDSIETEVVQPLDGDNKSEEIIEPETSEEAKENHISHPPIVEDLKSESQQLDNKERIEEQRELESSTEVCQDMHITATKPVETETSYLDDGKELEIEESADYIFVEKPSLHLETENLVSRDATCTSDNTQIETEATADVNEIEESLNTPIENTALETDVNNDLTVIQDESSIDATGQLGSEVPHESGNLENTKLSSSEVELKPEAEVDDAFTENGDGLLVPGVGADVDISVARDESISASSVNDLKPEAGLGNGFIEGSKSIPEATNDADEIRERRSSHPVEQTAIETEAINDSTEENDRTGSAPPQANGHNENTALPSSDIQLEPEANVENLSAQEEVEASDGPVACADVELPVERDGGMPDCSVDDSKSEAELGTASTETNQSVPVMPANDLERGANATNGITISSNLPADNSESELDAASCSPASKDELSSSGIVNSQASDGFVINGESTPDLETDAKDAEKERDPSICADANGEPICEDNSVEEIDSNRSLSPSPEDSTSGEHEGTKVEVEKPYRYLIRIPRYVDERFRTQIDLAQKQVEDKTRIRDELRLTFQTRRTIAGEYRDKFQAARSEERASRDALHAKRHEMDSVLLVINRMKNANSIEDIGDRVRSMQHRIEHETVPLKEEKQLIREIKQLKNLRDQLSSNLGQGAELEPTSDERVKTEERFKLLKQEMESCRKEVMRLEGITRAAWKIYHEENEKIKEMQDQFRASDDLRQEAYLHLSKLKKQFYDKNHYFRMFNDDIMKAKDYASARDTESLHSHCISQVEKMMELWNKNDEFRNEYIRCNKFHTLRRLGTADGRALGPDELAPALYPVRDVKADKPVLASSANKTDFPSLPASSEQGKSVGVAKLEQKKPEDELKPVVNLEQKQSTVKPKTITKPAVSESNSSVTVSSTKEEELENEEMKRKREKEELARKEEELRKKEEAVKLKEQRRLEEKAKAKEAEERKKRNAEKAQARAELKAQKEAELKEKEREKRARKKERKKEKTEGGNEGSELSSITEEIQPPEKTSQEPEIKEKPKTVVKRNVMISKQAKPKVIPPPLPLRNRGKKRMQQWMWILVVVVAIIALFLIGNIGFSFNFGLPSFGF